MPTTGGAVLGLADTSLFIALDQERPPAGPPMPLNDSWIAATAIARGIPVVSQDADYDDVPGLQTLRV